MNDLVLSGQKKIAWAKRFMPVLTEIEKDFVEKQVFSGLKITVCIHLEAKTACFVKMLKNAGAIVTATGCNPLSTQDDVCEALRADGIRVCAKHGVSMEEYERHLEESLSDGPDLILDDGGDLTDIIHHKMPHLADNLIGGTEETTTGVNRLKNLAQKGEIKYPIIAANDAMMKFLFDNRYGTGQSVWDGINRTTNLVVAGKTVVIAGYGWCGRGAALRAKGLGAKVIITEIDEIKAIEAVMDGHTVMKMDDAAKLGDIFVTLTGCKDVITKEHFNVMKNGAVLANAGHFDVEINKNDLLSLSVSHEETRQNIETYTLTNGNEIHLLAEGRLVNLAAGDGHPAEIMDMSFSVQALALHYLKAHKDELLPGMHYLPEEINRKIAKIKLESLGAGLDALTAEQKSYYFCE
ncbi:MAG: adenosylhomocysteinase [Ruminococcaceae bacterium]|nr:adenosylhomocysteinase [Oscillospiraceae bacterium]